jgi:expansin (peptidoglycan-binding protein)
MYQPSQLVVQNITGLFLLICLNCISASTVYAQAAQLEGVSVQLGTGYEQGWLRFKDVKLTRSNTRLDMQDVSNSGVPLVLGLGYTKVLGASATLGGLVEYNPISNRAALSIVPGYMLNEQVQGYLKLGWVYATTSVDQGPGARAIASRKEEN